MAISYHGIVGFGSGKSTLPSVETWGNNMNILRDPPKSIYTRKIDKVGQTSEITTMIDDSSDRACEAILVYARGVNPMVAVSYDNYGNNGGQKSGNVSQRGLNTNGGSSKQAYLPYRIMNGGAFRPPIREQRDLYPLSRLPRLPTSANPSPGFADFSKKLMCPSDTGKEFRNVKKDNKMIKSDIRPTATYKLEKPIQENYEVKYVIKNPIQVEGISGIQPVAKFNGEIGRVTKMVQDPIRPENNVNFSGQHKINPELSHFNTKKYTQNVIHSDIVGNLSGEHYRDGESVLNTDKYTHELLQGEINVNLIGDHYETPDLSNFNTNKYTHDMLQGEIVVNPNGDHIEMPDLSNFNTNKYTHDMLQGDLQSNISQNISVNSLEDIYDIDMNRKIKNNFNIDYTAPQTGYEKNEYIHSDIELERTLPIHESRTNNGRNIHKRLENQTIKSYSQNRPMVDVQTNYGGNHLQGIDNISSRNYNLKPTISAGGMDGIANRPQLYHENSIQEFDPQKSKFRKSIYNMQQERFSVLGKIPYL